MISAEALHAFRQIWKDEFGEEVADEVAVEEAVNLLAMFDAIYRPLRQSDINEYENAYGKRNVGGVE